MDCGRENLKIYVRDMNKKKIGSLEDTGEELYDNSNLKKLVDNVSENNPLERVIPD